MEQKTDNHYDDRSFWRKLGRFGRSAGRRVVETSLCLYFAARSPQTPGWARAVIIGALGYFILPTDAVPDVLPGVGFTDDLGALAGALGLVATHVTPEMRERARAAVGRWFGDRAGEGVDGAAIEPVGVEETS